MSYRVARCQRGGGSLVSSLVRAMEPALLKWYRSVRLPPPPNLEGDRDVEYTFIAAHMPQGPGEAIEVGCGASYLSLLAARCGFRARAVDLLPIRQPYVHDDLALVQGDFVTLSPPAGGYSLVINCSVVEHIGLTRYGDGAAPEGDIEAMAYLLASMRTGATMLLTIPVGRDAVVAPYHRVYGPQRLPRLLAGYERARTEYWAKDADNRWVQASEEAALATEASATYYALGCFVLRKPECATVA
ncbi:MAG TPA: DUF268 domain-containing protein [Chthonomonadales bacterium]|nr:DUF268 domain-containing protein [Chthonomonadales bacterium]